MLKKIFYTKMVMACTLSSSSFMLVLSGFSMEKMSKNLLGEIFFHTIVPHDSSTGLDMKAYQNIAATCKKWNSILQRDLTLPNPFIHKKILEYSFEHLKGNPSEEIRQIAQHFSAQEILSLFLFYEGHEDVFEQYVNKTIPLFSFEKLKEKKLFMSIIRDFKLKHYDSIHQNFNQSLAYLTTKLPTLEISIFKKNENGFFYTDRFILEYHLIHKDKYVGRCLNHKAHGRGILTFETGMQYKGDFVEGKQTGRGTLTINNGNQYEGDFVDNELTGKGILTCINGDRYEGDFLDGKLTGKGTLTWANGDRYEGDFVGNQRTGKGVLTWINGDRYEGDFLEDRRTGQGIFTRADGHTDKGEFVDGVLKK